MSSTAIGTPASIEARIDRIPIGSWHARIAAILAVATFFDGFDALTIAFVMPVLVKSWSLGPVAVGALIGIGYVGQAAGSLLFGWLAGKIGRIPTIRITVALIGVFSLACAAAQSYEQLAVLRFVQGIGLGGEVPIAAVYINEIVRADRRGRLFFFYQASFGIGVIVAGGAAAYLVPRVGWQSMFLIGAVPGLLALVLGRLCPESPRWLASQGRMAEAEAVVDRIEQSAIKSGPLPPPESLREEKSPGETSVGWSELFRGAYRTQTIATALLWIAANGCLYGLGTWMPTLLTKYYAVPLQQALNFSLVINVAGFASLMLLALAADRISRRTLLATCLTIGAGGQIVLALSGVGPLSTLVPLMALSMLCFNAVAAALYLYTAELYPTRLRALGTGFASFCLRVTAVTMPFLVGAGLRGYGPVGAFAIFAGLASAGAIAAWTTARDTRGHRLAGEMLS